MTSFVVAFLSCFIVLICIVLGLWIGYAIEESRIGREEAQRNFRHNIPFMLLGGAMGFGVYH